MDEGGGLENRYMGNCIVGSNPTPSASYRHQKDPQIHRLGSSLCRPTVKSDRKFWLGGLRLPLQQIGHSLRQFVLHVGQNVGIYVQGYANAGVA